MQINKTSLFLILFSTFIWSCSDSVFEKKIDFKEGYWLWKEPVSIPFEITDAGKSYDLSFFVRNSIDYEFQNLYIQYYLEDSAGNVLTEKLHNLVIFDPKTGKPLGEGLGDTYDIERTFLPAYTFSKEGNYNLRFDQFMRQDTLKNIQAIGFKITESKTEN
jgi:gliding motility-associated lipoprotein GldH